MLVCPPGERMLSASALPAVAVTSRIADSLTPRPRPPVQDSLIGLCWPALGLDGSDACKPALDPALTPKARRTLAPSTVISADCSLALRNDGSAALDEALAAGVSRRNSCQRRPETGSDCIGSAAMVDVTGGEAGSGLSAAVTMGQRCAEPCCNAA